MRHFLASACSNTFSLIKEVSIEFAMSAMDIVSTPPASPHSYSPALIALATVAIACSPLEHCLLMPCRGTLKGIPAVPCACVGAKQQSGQRGVVASDERKGLPRYISFLHHVVLENRIPSMYTDASSDAP
eukprot:1195036-Prorocentrum_minimum.AAC.13